MGELEGGFGFLGCLVAGGFDTGGAAAGVFGVVASGGSLAAAAPASGFRKEHFTV